MKRTIKLTFILLLLFGSIGIVHPEKIYKHSALEEIIFSEVKIINPFWNKRIEQTVDITLPIVWKLAEDQGRIENFKIVAGQSNKKYTLRNSPDAPVYKLIECTAYGLSQHKNDSLENYVNQIISLAAKAQDSNGYLHTQYMLPVNHALAPDSNSRDYKVFGFGDKVRWVKKMNSSSYGYSQLFTAGHMFEAAVAWYRATGNRNLLTISIKFADHIVKIFKNNKMVKDFGDHPQFEIGIMKLYEVTGNIAYLDLANKIARYSPSWRPHDINKENRKPLHDQRNAYGHCVRTAYQYTGATDVLRATGAADLDTAVMSLWRSVTSRKMYIHGGTGNGTPAEQHGEDYDLPIEQTYSECCANIAQAQWNHSLNLRTGNAEHADVIEHIIYANQE